MTYSIIIPSYNSETTIQLCLQALSRQQFTSPYEIIVVDSSADRTPEIIRRHFPQVHLIHRDTKTDPGSARNIGIAHAQGDILCFTDSDCIADPHWLHHIAAAHHDDYAAVGGAVLNGNPDTIVGWAGYLAEFREYFPCHAKQPMLHIASCNISYKRRVFDQYAPFSPYYYPQEDLVFNLQLHRHHDLILFDPAIKVAHINKSSLRHFLAHQRRIGRITSHVLQCFPELKGAAIAKSRLFTLFSAPFLPWVKLLNTFKIAALSKEYLRAFIYAAPLLVVGLLIWEVGFIQGTFLPVSR